MPGCKNILKRLDYDKIKTMEVEFLPPTYGGDVLFVFLAVGTSTSHSKARSMFGMDKRYSVMDGITKLCSLSNWAYIQRNMFPGQGDDSNKVFILR